MNPPFSPSSLFADVQTYHDFGHHRTSTAADLATQDWLASRLAALGLDIHHHPYTFNRFQLDTCTTQIQDKTLETFPIWFPQITTGGGVTAPLAHYHPDYPPQAYGRRIVFVDSTRLAQTPWHKDIYQNIINTLAQDPHCLPAALLFAAPHPTGE
ncbi:MAG: hypothetical protein ACYTGQ_18370, partial [Planctomycetota bacterium]